MQMDFDPTVFEGRKGVKPRLYLILDCETATLPFASQIARDEREKKNIAIARPLIYDLAWRVVDRNNKVYAEKTYLIAETFAVPAVFNTAYYREKRPIYLEKMEKGEMDVVPWSVAAKDFERDMSVVDYVGAFNSMFDFKKAIPFTELYIKKLYSPQYEEWERDQQRLCVGIARGENKKASEREFDPNNFTFRKSTRPLIDLWGISCRLLINTLAYKRQCLENDMISESGLYFKTSAETTFRYLQDRYDFMEAHTALEDVIIETQILAKALHRAKVPEGIIYFPFKELGETPDFLREQSEKKRKSITPAHCETVIRHMAAKLDEYEQLGKERCGFATALNGHLLAIRALLEEIRDSVKKE